jgi:hypothetical protein
MALDAEGRTEGRGGRAHGLDVGAERIALVLGPDGVLARGRHVGEPTATRAGDHSNSIRTVRLTPHCAHATLRSDGKPRLAHCLDRERNAEPRLVRVVERLGRRAARLPRLRRLQRPGGEGSPAAGSVSGLARFVRIAVRVRNKFSDRERHPGLMRVGRGVAAFVQQRGGRVFVWGDDFPSGRWGRLRVAFEKPSAVEFGCSARNGFELCLDASITFGGPVRLSIARFPRRHLVARSPGWGDGSAGGAF